MKGVPTPILLLALLQVATSAFATPTRLSISAHQTTGSQLTLDVCRDRTECDRPERNFCSSVNRGAIGHRCTKELPNCRCLPDILTSCTGSEPSECPDGEVCATYTPGASGLLAANIRMGDNLGEPFCVSAQAEEELSDIELLSGASSQPTGSEPLVDITTSLSPGGGLGSFNLDTCDIISDCISGGRAALCLSLNSGFVGRGCSAGFTTCRCVTSVETCASDEDCLIGEVCAVYTRGTDGPLGEVSLGYEELRTDTPFCVSEEAEKAFKDIEKFPTSSPPSDPTGDAEVVDAMTPLEIRGEYTLDKCTDSEECLTTSVSNSLCLNFQEDNTIGACSDGNECRCFPHLGAFIVCADNSFCPVGEGCVKFVGERGTILTQIQGLDFTRQFCMSVRAAEERDDVELLEKPPKAPTTDAGDDSKPDGDGGGGNDGNDSDDGDGSGESSSDDDEDGDASGEDEVCIDARAVAHLAVKDLVYERAVRASVLCDVNESCATAGHLVVFQGEAMRMSAYCAMTECRRKVLHVNSPRFAKGVRIASRTEGLEFTAFAARFDTRVEEFVLSTAVRMGL